MRFLIVTGTDTGVGKTIATAALAVRAASYGGVLVVKPVQTGVGGPGSEPRDVDVVGRLAGVPCEQFVELRDPLAPDTAARRQGVALPSVAAHAARLVELGASYDTVLVEGAGGLLVRLDADGGTLLDLVAALPPGAAEAYVVTRPGLGTLNHTELTVRALRPVCPVSGLVIGAWPEQPGLAERTNLEELPRVAGVPVVARIPDGVGTLGSSAFRAGVASWFETRVGGTVETGPRG